MYSCFTLAKNLLLRYIMDVYPTVRLHVLRSGSKVLGHLKIILKLNYFLGKGRM
jgi:hypothetical protein